MNDLFAALYEGFYPWELFYIYGLSQDMYDSGAYVVVGWFWLLSCVVLMLAYYYALSNYGNWYKLGYWFVWILVACLINFAAAYSISVGEMEIFYQHTDDGSPYGFSEHFSFSMVNVLWTFLLCIVLSILFKLKSVKASRTPF